MYHISIQSADEHMINVHYYYYYIHICRECVEKQTCKPAHLAGHVSRRSHMCTHALTRAGLLVLVQRLAQGTVAAALLVRQRQADVTAPTVVHRTWKLRGCRSSKRSTQVYCSALTRGWSSYKALLLSIIGREKIWNKSDCCAIIEK